MTASGPAALPADYTGGSSEKLSVSHPTLHANIQDELQAVWTKYGLGTTNATPTANSALIALASGVSQWAKTTKSQLVVGSGSNVTTTSGTFADMDAATMSTSWVSSGGVLIAVVISTLGQSATGGDYTRLGVSINGTDYIGTSHANSTSNFRGAGIAIGRAAPVAGTYTIKPRFHTSTATTTTALSVGGERYMLILELVTGS